MPKNKISFYFLGTDTFAATILERLLDDYRFEILGALVLPDTKVGRKQILTPCPVKILAEERGLSVLYDADKLLGKKMDFLVVASYGRILPSRILDLPKFVSLNVHASLLPKYRGASPIQTAILNGDRVTGVCVMKMLPKLDAGPVYSLSEVPVGDHNAESLRAELANFGAELLAQTLPGIVDGVIEFQEQDFAAATYCPKIERFSGEVQWNLESAEAIKRKLRAYFPWPGIYTFFQGKRLKIYIGDSFEGPLTRPGLVCEFEGKVCVGTRKGLFALEEVQLEGKNRMNIRDFVRGYPEFFGTVLQ